MANYAKTDAKFLKPRESIRFNKINVNGPNTLSQDKHWKKKQNP